MKRVFVIMAAAAAITAVTYVVFPQTFIYFGILHAIAAASFIGRPFVTIRLRICAATIVLMFAAPFVFDMASFDTRWLAWTGLAANPAASNDFVPVLPSAAFTLLGIVATRLLLKCDPTIHQYMRSIRVAPTLMWAGTNSLAIYLIHQPILLAIFASAAALAG